jgi:hypothetical protein
VNVIGLNREVLDLYFKLRGFVSKQLFEVRSHIAGQYRKTILWRPNEVIVEVGYPTRCSPILHEESMRNCYTENNHLTRRKGGAPDFLCRLKATVPVR